MTFPMNFIRRTGETCAFDKYIPAPCLRKSFQAEEKVTKAGLLICGLGFYELFVNGERITKGALAPYISSPDDILYYDEYDLTDRMKGGENVVGVILGNGMQNCFGASVWDFDKARWRGAPQLSLRLEISFENGETLTVESDESFKTSPSPILFDDLRCGEYYDARKEQKGWNEAGFDDSGWKNAEKAPLPRGEQRLCQAEPIAVSQTLTPVCVTRQGDGWLYDFGVNSAGVCELNLCGKPGQEISLEHGEHLINGELNLRNIQCVPDGYMQKDIYICKGNGAETYIPRFTYHGFRYVLVKGITPEQATAELLTYLVMNSNLPERGGFECSDKTVNALQEMTRRSTLANFYYFPTDCPHREKNGWMGDAAVSAEHTLLNLQAENSYREWLHNIRKAQDDRGALPGLVPTGGWGFSWGNGPAWDCALTWIPYYVYIYRGDKEILRENAGAILRYLHYLSTRIRGDGLVCFGLGDWCPPGKGEADYTAPLELTDSVISMDICEKAAFIFGVLGMDLHREFAEKFGARLRAAIRFRLIDFSAVTAAGNCQTAQAMVLYFNVLENGERAAFFSKLLALIDRDGGLMTTGLLGARVIFHVLSAFGESDLAYQMITTPEFPSYGNLVARGETSIPEMFQPEGGRVASLNHHMFGDISGWFIREIAGIHLNPSRDNVNEILIRPSFIGSLEYAKGFHIAPAGKISVFWKRNETGAVDLNLEAPETVFGKIVLPEGFRFEDGRYEKSAVTGGHRLVREY